MSRKRKIFQDEMEPTEKLTSDGDLLVKNLVKKQLSKKTNLLEELKTQKEFQSPTEYIPISNFCSGVSLLSEFTKTSEYIQELEQFKAAGLSQKDMDFYIEHALGENHVKLKHKNLDSSNIKERLEKIQLMLNKHEEQLETCSKSGTSRHQTEFMLSIKPGSTETTLLKFALDNKKKMVNDSPSAIDELKHIEREMMNSLNCEPLKSDIQKKIRKKEERIKSLKLRIEEPKSRIPQSELVKNSQWDVKEIKIDEVKTEKNYGCEKRGENLYTITNGKIVKLNGKSSPTRNEYKKYSLEEIKQIPKFAEYAPGNPSKTLYIKNLSSVQENDLENLFKAFSFQYIGVKILKGRMKGQAFIEMENSELAKQALSSLNGIVLKNKPIIIEFGRRLEEEER